ncbi:hypothetical protein PFISCL1PPCAC_1887, partial [Pristionchus fissidentatus]
SMSEALSLDDNDVETLEEAEDVVASGSKDRKCPWCPKIFVTGSALKHHLGICHATQPSISMAKKREGSGRLACPIGCEPLIASYDALLRHCALEHEFRAEHVNERFHDANEFKEWMAYIAAMSGGFVRKRGERKAADGTAMGDFHCIFDGKKRETPSTRAPDKSPYTRRVPSKKLGYACPAFIRYTIDSDGSVTCRAQVCHFGHPIKPVDRSPNHRKEQKTVRHYNRSNARGATRSAGYAFDGSGYEDVSTRHAVNQMMEEDELDVDEHGMVPLFSISLLERARFVAQSSCTSMDIAFAEVQSIPHENVQHVAHLIDKFNEITAAAAEIESTLKAMTTVPERQEESVQETIADDDATKVRLHAIRKRPRRLATKNGLNENVKHPRIGSNEDEESFERQSETGEIHYEDDERVEVEVEVEMEETVEDDLQVKEEEEEEK